VRFISENIDLESVDSVLYLGSASPAIIDYFCRRKIGVVVASEEPHQLLRIHESELINPSRLAFFMVSGRELSGLRADSFDLVISGYRLHDPSGFVPPPVNEFKRVSHRSGTVAIILYKENLIKSVFHLCEGRCGRRVESRRNLKEFMEHLHVDAEGMEIKRRSSSLFELVLLRFRVEETEDVRTILKGDKAEAMINA
jgi:hypothetical protein